MRNPTGQFEEILDRCIVAMQTRGQTVEECLAQYPAERAELEPLLLLAARLQRARSVSAPAAFRQSAAVRMQNLVAVAAPRARQPASSLPAWEWVRGLFGVPQLRRAAVWAGGLLAVLIVLSSSAVVASARALPGGPLYSVKTRAENWQLALTPDEAAAARLRIAYAARRLQEATVLVESGQPERAEPALVGYAEQIQRLLVLLETEMSLSPEARHALARQLNSALGAHQAQLAALQAKSGARSPSALGQALKVSQAGHLRATLLLDDELDEPPGLSGPTPTAPQQLTAVPPSVTPTAAEPTGTQTASPGSLPPAGAATPTPTPTLTEPLPQPTATRPALLPPQPTALPTTLPTRRPAPERTAQPTLRPPRPTELPTARPTARPTQAGPLPTPPLRPTGLPTPRPPLRPTDLPTPRPPLRPTDAATTPPTEWPTWPAQTETPWPTSTPTPGDPTPTPPAPPDLMPPRPTVPPGLRETVTAVPRPHRPPAP